MLVLQCIKHHRLQLEGIEKAPLFRDPSTLLADYYQSVDTMYDDLNQQSKSFVAERQMRLYALKKQLQGLSPSSRLKMLKDKMHAYERALKNQITYQFEKKKQGFNPDELRLSLQNLLLKQLQEKKEKLSHLSAHLKSINPKNLLKKGYCIPFAEKDHSVIMSTHAIKAGEKVFLRMHDGTVKSTVDEVSSKHD